MIKKIIMWSLVVLWMGVIFFFSSYNGLDSEEQSRGFLYHTLGNLIEFFDKDISYEQKEELIIKYDPIVRKIAHVSVFFILTILVCLALNQHNLDIKRIILYSSIICILYACSDEIHQLFVSDRSGKVLDVLIDSIGICFANLLFYLRRKND